MRTSRRRYVVGAVLAVLGVVGGMLGVPLLLVAAALLAPVVVPRLARVVGWPGRRFGALPGQARLPERGAQPAPHGVDRLAR